MTMVQSSVTKFLFFALALCWTFTNEANAQQSLQFSSWHMQPVPIHTRWAKDVSPANAMPEYPRPQLARGTWTNLNGLWDYAVTAKDAAMRGPTPAKYDGQILVPYPIESALSGVKRALKPTENLWYRRNFERPALKNGERVLLHFGAVDYQAIVYINGLDIGSHQGGYTAFDFDITKALKDGNNEILVKVYDPTDQGIGPHGKQVLNPQNIYYTATSGIWQTVWLETVPSQYISSFVITPDIDKSIVNIEVRSGPASSSSSVELTIDGRTIKGKSNSVIRVQVPNARLWSPASPYLYYFTARLGRDVVHSYFGMRKISVAKDGSGVERICLNNKPYYNLGVLDQGFWPEGLYTAPTDEALKFDIEAIKAMGFNTIRKHIKIEPARWYYHADRIGMLVWQDFVNPNQGLPEGAKQAFERGIQETLEQLHNNPSIVLWTLFNEKWGQYDQQRLTEWVKKTDPSRLVNGHSGEYLYVNDQLRSPSPNAYIASDLTDVHSYPFPRNALALPGKARVLGEFGGIGVFVPDHQWNSSSAWGYVQEKPADLALKYRIMNQHLELLEKEGLSGSIYTQPFDVEGEQNGLMTYDREVIKIPFAELRQIHARLNPEMGVVPEVTADNADLANPAATLSHLLQQYIDGNREMLFLKRLIFSASQAGDKPGADMAASSYISLLKSPLSEEDIHLVVQFTKSSKDPGFRLLLDNKTQFETVLGERPLTVDMMNMIFHGELEPIINAGGDNPDWQAIEAIAMKFGDPGEEIYLRAATVFYFNHRDWTAFRPTAQRYLDKFGKNLSEDERKTFQQAIDQH